MYSHYNNYLQKHEKKLMSAPKNYAHPAYLTRPSHEVYPEDI